MADDQHTDKIKILRQLLRSGRLFQWLSFVFLLAIVVMIVVWQPWRPMARASDRTVSVTGTATITATPDQYVFSPTYNFTQSDKQAALDAVSAKSNEVVAKLKALGVADKDIKTNASGYDYGYYVPIYGGNNMYSLYLTITVTDAKLAQKVQDYLVTTSPTGQVTPTVSFTTAKQQQLQSQARDKAEQDARKQADQSAKNLGFSVGAVKSVSDGNLASPGPIPYSGLASGANLDMEKSLTVQPGQNELTYSVTVVYYIQ